MKRWQKVAIATTCGLALGLTGNRLFLSPWYLHWGTTQEESHRTWPGDELVAQPGHCTRAITIHAPAEQVWPWIMQIGQDRGGFYSYTWLENLFLAEMKNADRIVPEFQPRQVGDVVWMTPQKRYGGKARMSVAQLIPNRAWVLVQPDELPAALRRERVHGGVWQFLLDPIDANHTRLVMRGAAPDRRSIFYDLVFDPAHFLMERRMMLGIKERAEQYGR